MIALCFMREQSYPVKGKILSSGGRVLNVVTKSKNNLKFAINKAYEAVKKISFENEYYRTDIGKKGL